MYLYSEFQFSLLNGITWTIGVPAGMVPSNPSLIKNGRLTGTLNTSVSTIPVSIWKGKLSPWNGAVNKHEYPFGVLIAQGLINFNGWGCQLSSLGYSVTCSTLWGASNRIS